MAIDDPTRTYLVVANVCLATFAVAFVLLGVWAAHGQLPATIRAKYPRHLLRMSQLPFAELWRTEVDAQDLAAFVRARKRGLIFLLGLFVLSHVLSAYAYLHAVVALWRCHMMAAGLL